VHDSVASFYGGYDPTARVRPLSRRLLALLVIVGVAVLVMLTAAGVVA
jgi:hypothetical protein